VFAYSRDRPTLAREKKTWWDVETDRFVVPRAFGWGYAFNQAKLAGRTKK
jgi:hypothetical protein